MNMRTTVARLDDALRSTGGVQAAQDVLGDIDYGVRLAEDLRAAVLAEHRSSHTEIRPDWCTEACRLAAEDW